MKYKKLFSEINLGGISLRNRIVMTAVDLNYCAEGYGQISRQFEEFYYRRAEGGTALFVIGGCRVDDHGAGGLGFVSIEDDSYVAGHRHFTEEMHKRGAKVALQLYQAGAYSPRKGLRDGKEPFAPSAVYSQFTHDIPHEMTVDEIKLTIQKLADAALRAKEAGYDAVELLGSAGYLMNQFLSPVKNQRKDEYGGSPENRMRFSEEAVCAVRNAVGNDFPIMMRVSGNDFVQGSNTNDEVLGFVKKYEEWGINILDVTGGWHETSIPQLPGDVPHGMYSYLAENIKKSVSIPVIVANRINSPDTAENILEMERADAVGMMRACIADPCWPEKALNDRSYLIRPCVGCNQGCLSSTFFGKPVKCLVNADAGFECKLHDETDLFNKRFLIIGSGPAGLEASVRLAECGAQVVIWEKENRIGGQMNLVCKVPGNEDYSVLIAYYEAKIKDLGIEIYLGKETDVNEIIKGKYEKVIIATGANPKYISLPGFDESVDVVSAWDVLNGDYIPGKNVIILGGGAVGLETARFLGRHSGLSPQEMYFLEIHGAENRTHLTELYSRNSRIITVIEISDKLGSGFDPGCGWPTLKDLKRMGINSLVNAHIVNVSDGRVVIDYHDKTNYPKRRELDCDSLILSVGSVSDNKLETTLSEAGINTVCVGDCIKPGKILDAISQARDIVCGIRAYCSTP